MTADTHPYDVERSRYWDPRRKEEVDSDRYWALQCRRCAYRFPRRGSRFQFIDGGDRDMYRRAIEAFDAHTEGR